MNITVNNFYKQRKINKQLVNDIFIGIVKQKLSLDSSDAAVVSYLQDLPCRNRTALKRGDVV